MALTTRQRVTLFVNCFLVIPLLCSATCAAGQVLFIIVLSMIFPGHVESQWPPGIGGAIFGLATGPVCGGHIFWLLSKSKNGHPE